MPGGFELRLNFCMPFFVDAVFSVKVHRTRDGYYCQYTFDESKLKNYLFGYFTDNGFCWKTDDIYRYSR